uniref:Polynucleotide 5'-phosphatase n=1 Tax=Acrobeloides nanus TaxID=290746 RepID=A0A914CZQ8_9BILA
METKPFETLLPPNRFHKCDFRFDINVANRAAHNLNGSYELRMQLETVGEKDLAGDNNSVIERRTFSLDATTLQFLSQELDKMIATIPKCQRFR